MSNWQEYYQNTKNNPPSKLLQEGVSFVKDKLKALDLGAGALVDSKYLLSLGFEVVAVDKENVPEQIAKDKFMFIKSLFKDYNFPKSAFDLVNAQFSLPFNGEETFSFVWEKILSSLKPQGIFVGQLFGLNDEWNIPGTKLAFYSKEQVKKLVTGLEVLKLHEVDKIGKLANGDSKHRHFFNIIVRK